MPTGFSTLLSSSSRMLASSVSGETLPGYDKFMPRGYYKVFQVVNGLLSFLSSFIMAIAIAGGEEGLTTPYHRIIFGLSMSDIFQSLALLVGPLSVPPGSYSPEPLGNEVASCRANGFMLHVGMLAVMMYTVHLCLYYLCKLKYKMTADSFKHKIEMKMHAITALVSVGAGISGLVMDVFHTGSIYLSFCSAANVPTRCFFILPLGEEPGCDETSFRRADIFNFTFIVTLPMIFLSIILITTGLLCHHAYVTNKNIEKQLRVPTTLRGVKRTEEGGDTPAKHKESKEDAKEESKEGEIEEENETPQDRLRNVSRLYLRENMIQAMLYVGAFLLTYSFLAVANWVAKDALFATVIFFLPLGGFLNILVYTRPKVATLRRRFPECSWIRAFWLVLRAGGDIPVEVDLSLSFCQECCRPPAWYESENDYTNAATSNGNEPKNLSAMGMQSKLSWLGF